MEKCIIVAIADNNAIGKDNALLWHISEDLKFFKRTTMGCPVIMGRKTFESIGRPLPKRLNIVISRGFEAPEGVVVVGSLEEAYRAAEKGTPVAQAMTVPSSPTSVISDQIEEPRCFVIGGGQIYAQAMPDMDRLVVTHVHTVIDEADTFFPSIDPEVWQVIDRSEMYHDEESGYDFEFVIYGRCLATN
ncbi:MAG: dihydrofolate reductase [Bacteroidales bacterium]|nr:dihydrofolate reductase [Bacteroidales bacterium]